MKFTILVDPFLSHCFCDSLSDLFPGVVHKYLPTLSDLCVGGHAIYLKMIQSKHGKDWLSSFWEKNDIRNPLAMGHLSCRTVVLQSGLFPIPDFQDRTDAVHLSNSGDLYRFAWNWPSSSGLGITKVRILDFSVSFSKS